MHCIADSKQAETKLNVSSAVVTAAESDELRQKSCPVFRTKFPQKSADVVTDR